MTSIRGDAMFSPLHARPILAIIVVAAALGDPRLAGAQGATSWSAVEQAFGRAGVPQAGDVMRFNFPRRDLKVMVGDVAVRPSLALGSWVAFKRMANGQAM